MIRILLIAWRRLCGTNTKHTTCKVTGKMATLVHLLQGNKTALKQNHHKQINHTLQQINHTLQSQTWYTYNHNPDCVTLSGWGCMIQNSTELLKSKTKILRKESNMQTAWYLKLTKKYFFNDKYTSGMKLHFILLTTLFTKKWNLEAEQSHGNFKYECDISKCEHVVWISI
jgi:hypothetical protein